MSVDARAAEALDFIKKMIDAGDLGATARVSEVVEDGFEIEIDGGKSELLVGRGGNALDALQFLVGIIVNRKHEGKVRITIDAAGYRRKHKEALEAMALEIAGQVQGQDLVVNISNDGPAIPSEHLPHLFEPFFTTKPNGTGLGLFICHNIVEQHGGTLEVSNLPDETGVQFTITLPYKPETP